MIVYTHVPRTCGTAFKNHVAGAVVCVHGEGSAITAMDRQYLVDFRDPDRYRFIAGHFGYCVRSVLPGPLRFITMLRDPIQRSLSYIKFMQRVEPHYLHHHVRDMDIEQAVDDSLVQKVVGNSQARYLAMDFDVRSSYAGFGAASMHLVAESWHGLSGDELLAVARHRLEHDYVAFGIAERHQESTNHVLKVLGLPQFDVGREHPLEDHTVGLDRETLSVLEDINRVDTELYRFAMELCMERTKNENSIS